jgi:hypothetical protein
MAEMIEEKLGRAIRPMQETLDEIKLTVNSIQSNPPHSPQPPAPYRTALLANRPQTGRNSHPASAPTIIDEQRALARVKAQARQVLLLLTAPAATKAKTASTSTIITELNNRIQLTLPDAPHRITTFRLLESRYTTDNRQRALLECNSENAATWVRSHPNITLIDSFDQDDDCIFAPREHSICVKFVPTQFDPDNEDSLSEITEINNIEDKDLICTR